MRLLSLFLLLLGLAFFTPPFLHSTPTSKIKNSPSISTKKRNFDRQLQQNLENIAFSSSYFDAQNAMDFLIDNPKLSLSPLLKLLYNPDIPTKNLLNIWNITHYILEDLAKPRLHCKNINELMTIQKSHQPFLVKIVDDYLLDCKEIEKSIRIWMGNPSVLVYQGAFLLIQKHHLVHFGPDILKKILFSINPTKQEMGLGTLLDITPKNLDTLKLLPFLQSPISTIRNKAARLLSLYHQNAKHLMEIYSRSSNDLEKSAIITALSKENSDEVFEFMLKNYLGHPETTTEMNRFFLRQIKTPKRTEEFLALLQKTGRESEILSVLNIISFLIPRFSSHADLLQKIHNALLEDIHNSGDLISRLVQKIETQIHTTLRRDFSINN